MGRKNMRAMKPQTIYGMVPRVICIGGNWWEVIAGTLKVASGWVSFTGRCARNSFDLGYRTEIGCPLPQIQGVRANITYPSWPRTTDEPPSEPGRQHAPLSVADFAHWLGQGGWLHRAICTEEDMLQAWRDYADKED